MSKRSFIQIVALLCATLFSSFLYLRLPEVLNGTSPEDYPNYYIAGKRVLEGRSVYSPLEDEVRKTLGWHYAVYPADPPATLVAIAPLALLPYPLSWLLFAVLSVIIFLYSLSLALRELETPAQERTLALSLCLISSPFLFLMYRNHAEAWILLFLVLGWRALRNQHLRSAYAWWGVAAAMKLFPLLWLLLAAMKRPKTALVYGALPFLLVSLIGVFVVGLPSTLTFITSTIPHSRDWYGAIGNYSLVSAATALGVPIIGWVSAVAILITAIWRARFSMLSADSIMVHSVLASLLISPLSWMNYQILLFPVLFLLVRDSRNASERYVTLALCAVIAYWPGIVSFASGTVQVAMSMTPTWIMLGLFLLAPTLLPSLSSRKGSSANGL